MTRFQGKSVLVTGGSRGIGKAIALRFAELGAERVAIGYLRADGAAAETARELESLGAEAVLLRGNVGDPERVERLLENAGRPDIVIANAATGVNRPLLELEEKHWDWTMNANARSLFTLARRLAPSLAPGTSIVAISSLGATRVLDDYVLVGVSKAATEALVRYLAVELAPLGVRVNAVSAGLVETDALDHFEKREDMLSQFRSRTPAGRLVMPEEVAAAIVFLAGPASRMVTGAALTVDGGWTAI